MCRAQALLERVCVPGGSVRQGTMLEEARDIMWPSLPSNGRDRQTNVKGTPPGGTMCANSVEGETQRVATRSEQRIHLRLQRGHTIGIQEGEQESRSPPATLACTSPQR